MRKKTSFIQKLLKRFKKKVVKKKIVNKKKRKYVKKAKARDLVIPLAPSIE